MVEVKRNGKNIFIKDGGKRECFRFATIPKVTTAKWKLSNRVATDFADLTFEAYCKAAEELGGKKKEFKVSLV